MATGFSLKDHLFNPVSVGKLAARFRAVDPGFDPEFEAAVLAEFPALELKQRIACLAARLDAVLPQDFGAAAEMIEAALPPPLDPSRSDDDFGEFIYAPLGDFAVLRGLEHHRERSLDLLLEVTQRSSMEFAIRPFLSRWPKESFARLSDWAEHPNYHVRRLVSEGTRPRLPWGQKIGWPVDRAMPLLDRLHADPTRYVTRSVANHLNDVSRPDPALVMDRLAGWAAQGSQARRELDWMTAHALRTLVKEGDPRALDMLGYRRDAPVTARLTLHSPQVAIGAQLAFTAKLEAASDTPVLVDYVLYRRRADGTLAPKVFKLKQAVVRAGRPLTLDKKIRLKGDATTYRTIPGAHALALQVNGVEGPRHSFDVTD